jgi:hypothetical protein
MKLMDLGADIIRQITSYLDASSYVSLLCTNKKINEEISTLANNIGLRHFESLKHSYVHSWYKKFKCSICGSKTHPGKFHKCMGCLQHGHSHLRCPNLNTKCEYCGSKKHLNCAHSCEFCRHTGHSQNNCIIVRSMIKSKVIMMVKTIIGIRAVVNINTLEEYKARVYSEYKPLTHYHDLDRVFYFALHSYETQN